MQRQEDLQPLKEEIRFLKEEINQWENIFDSINDLLCIVDREFRLVKVNRSLAQRFGVAPKELVGKSCYEVFHGLGAAPPICPHRRTLENRQPATEELENPYLDGFFQFSTYPLLNARHELMGSVHIVRDITEQKKMREMLLQSEKMASIGQLISGVTHELNNPLTGVIGFSQLLLAQDVDEKVKVRLEKINREAERAARIVQNLLTFSRQYKPERSLVSINELLERTLALRAYEMRVSNILVEMELDTNLPALWADPHQLQQVFLNIIINAEQAMLETHGKGKLSLKTALRRAKEGAFIEIQFADDGPGIRRQHLTRIFDPFFTTKKVGQGTGLGLSVSYGIIQEHKGRVYAESEEAHGSTFIVELPLLEQETPLPKKPARPVTGGPISGKQILLVEDEEAVAQMIAEVLEGQGQSVEIAFNGLEARKKIAQRHYDLIISDLKMPELSGQELYQFLKKTDPALAERILFSTGDALTQDTRDFLESTGNRYLMKPFPMEDILKAVQEVLG